MGNCWLTVKIGLSVRAKHPDESIRYLHGSLFNIKCSVRSCDYMDDPKFSDPIVPALTVPLSRKAVELKARGLASREEPLGDEGLIKEMLAYGEEAELPDLQVADLPMCLKCEGVSFSSPSRFDY